MYRSLLWGMFLFGLGIHPVLAQTLEEQIAQLESELAQLEKKKYAIKVQQEQLKLAKVRQDLQTWGLPALDAGDKIVKHQALSLVYDEEHEQAKWVAHLITPDVSKGNVSRTNDFRPDPKVSTGSAVEADYFLKYLQPDSSYKYDGYGYDRGHLAPSADFRWSSQALSESYFYSNMSPQRPEFNRGKWAELEGMIRGYIFRSPQTQLYVVTGPVLHDSLPKVERSINGVSLPEQYFKVVLDYDQQRAIGFLMPNAECKAPVETYAVSVDKVEQVTGLDLFPNLPDELENQVEAQRNPSLWLPDEQQDDVEPIRPEQLPQKAVNTVTARLYADRREKVQVCGTVVSTHLSRNGNTFINLDKKFPNQIFTVTIWKDNKLNFAYEPHIELQNRQVCIEGEVRLSQGVPTIDAKNEKVITFLEN